MLGRPGRSADTFPTTRPSLLYSGRVIGRPCPDRPDLGLLGDGTQFLTIRHFAGFQATPVNPPPLSARWEKPASSLAVPNRHDSSGNQVDTQQAPSVQLLGLLYP
jgi:hypothetical protein